MLLTGEYICKVDEKGRLSIPSRLRTLLGTSQVVVTKGFDGQCLSMFTPEFFEKTVTSAISPSSPKSSKRATARLHLIW